MLSNAFGAGTEVLDPAAAVRLLIDIGSAVSAVAKAEWTTHLDVVESATGPLMFVRPDGYVAWASDQPDKLEGLDHALWTWLGIGAAPTRSSTPSLRSS